MTEETTPVWREALQDRDHELYKAAWTLFGQNTRVEVASTRLGDQKDTVIPFLVTLVNDEDLYERDSLGDGNAPVNAIRLIGEWQVLGQLPLLLERLEETASYQSSYNVLLNAISEMGPDIVDDIVKWATENEEMRAEAATILNRLGDTKAYDVILGWMEPDEFQLETYATYLMHLDPERAITDLHQLANNREFEKEERQDFRNKSKEARKLARERKKQAAEAAAIAAAAPESSEETPETVAEVVEETATSDET